MVLASEEGTAVDCVPDFSFIHLVTAVPEGETEDGLRGLVRNLLFACLTKRAVAQILFPYQASVLG